MSVRRLLVRIRARKSEIRVDKRISGRCAPNLSRSFPPLPSALERRSFDDRSFQTSKIGQLDREPTICKISENFVRRVSENAGEMLEDKADEFRERSVGPIQEH